MNPIKAPVWLLGAHFQEKKCELTTKMVVCWDTVNRDSGGIADYMQVMQWKDERVDITDE